MSQVQRSRADNSAAQPEQQPPSRRGTAAQDQTQSRASIRNQSDRAESYRSQSYREPSNRGQLYNGGTQESGMSNKSPVPPISRTPSADRRLLRALTVSPNQDGGDATPEPEYTRQSPRKATPARQSTQGRQPTGEPNQGMQSSQAASPRQSGRSPTVTPSYRDSPGGESVRSRRSGPAETIRLPSPGKNTREDAWQSGKTVAEANNYMLKYEVASDVTFAVGDRKEEIRAHKYMLMARSPVFFKSLSKHLGNSDVKIGIPDMNPENFRDLLQYIYTDEFDIHTENVTFMLYAAKKFQLKGLSDLCFQYLDAEMHDETVAKIMEQAHLYNETNLYEKCVRFIFAHGDSVLRKPSFSELCSDCVERIIKSDELRANEEAVFEGCIIWANAECRRQKKQPTDENRRAVLGKLLYLIRFPIMDVTYFTQKVSLGNILSHDETLSIFQYFHGEEQQLPNRFSRNERNRVPRNIAENDEPVMLSNRRSPNMSRAHRFGGIDGQWKQNGPPDAISFSCSQPIILYGVEVYGVAYGQETYPVKMLVFDDITREEVRKNEASIFTNTIRSSYEVYLARPIRVPSKRIFTVVILMRGSPTHKGVDGDRIVIADGVTFEFSESNRSSNGTDVTVGQIPGLLFTKTQ